MTEKELVTHLRLLDYYKIEKNHKQFLSEANTINYEIELGRNLITIYSKQFQKDYMKGKMDWLKKSNKELYLKAYK